jgi:hypothetical protein
MLRPDGRYEAIQRNGVIGISDNVLGPYTVSNPAVWPQVSGLPKDWMEDPVMWYSGDLYHVVVNKWDTRKAYHITSKDGINNWKLEEGLAYDPTANFIRYTSGTVNRWNKLERPNVYMENGHVVAMLLSAINVAKDKDLGNDRHGSKVIVIPFDGDRFDSAGAPPTPAPRPAFTQIEAESFYTQLGVQTEACTEGGENVGYIENGDYVLYKRIEFGSGVESFQARIASAASGGNIELRLDSIDGKLIGTCPVTGTDGWHTWVTSTCSVSGVSGTHDLYLKFTGGSGYLYNLNWWQFNPVPVIPTPTPTGTKGDLNDDGNVNSIDFALLRLHLIGEAPLAGKSLSNADVNGDGSVNSIDFAFVRQYLLGIISSFS